MKPKVINIHQDLPEEQRAAFCKQLREQLKDHDDHHHQHQVGVMDQAPDVLRRRHSGKATAKMKADDTHASKPVF